MDPPYEPRVEFHGRNYYPAPYSATTLDDDLWLGLIALGTLGIISVVSTLLLIGFILSRFVTWRLHYKTFIGYNQYVVLVLNLLIADLQQSASFLISWHWYRLRGILAPSPACFAQGWLIHSGDVGSGLFVLAIAVHTFYTAVYGRRVGNTLFISLVAGLWVFAFFLTALGVGLHQDRYFVRAGAWCWVSSNFEQYRLWCHYFWIFLIEFGTIAIYIVTFWALRRKTRKLFVGGQLSSNSGHAATVKAVNRVTLLMTLYPCVYVLLTLPLSAGRMYSLANNGRPTSNAYSIVAGCLLTSCGWVDSLLYTLTRRRLLQDTMPTGSARRASSAVGGERQMSEASSKGIVQTRTVTVETDGLSDFEMEHPGGSQTSAFYDIAAAEGAVSPRCGTVEHGPPATGLERCQAAKRKAETTAIMQEFDLEGGGRREEVVGPVNVRPSLTAYRESGWTRLSDEQ